MRKTRLLLVDDESRILDGLQRLIRPLRHEWEVQTATSARAALALIAQEPPDVIITDMRMPEMDGAAFLAIAKQCSPSSVRIVLSGQTDQEAALRAVTVAHQFLSKPCDPATLLDILASVRGAVQALADERLSAAVGGGTGALPCAPLVWRELTELLADDEAQIGSVAAVIERDPAMAAKLLQLTNSSFFGLRRRLTSIAEAVSYLGVALVKSTVLALGIDESLPIRSSEFDAAAFQRYSVMTAHMARAIAVRPELADESFTAGLLHDIGALLLASALPERYDRIVRQAAETGRTFDEEEALLPECAPRARLGAYLLNLWGLPWAVVEAVANQERAPAVETAALGAAGAVYLARQVVDEMSGRGVDRLDRAFVERHGLSDRVGRWRERAQELGAG